MDLRRVRGSDGNGRIGNREWGTIPYPLFPIPYFLILAIDHPFIALRDDEGLDLFGGIDGNAN